jgi:RNA polymerase sigma factor (sigma-70 family)
VSSIGKPPAAGERGLVANPTRQDKFLSLLDEHRTILFKVVNSYGRTPADREDLVQEMTAQLWRSFERYDDRYPFSTWMYRVALNVAISFYRRESRRERHIVAAEDSVLESAAERSESSAADPDLRLLQRFLERLGELDRALMLLYLDGNRHHAIAEILGISETNVGTKIGRLKQRLRNELAGTT